MNTDAAISKLVTDSSDLMYQAGRLDTLIRHREKLESELRELNELIAAADVVFGKLQGRMRK